MNFDPFIDFEAVTEEMAADLHAALREHRDAAAAFVEDDRPDPVKCARAVAAATEVNMVVGAIVESLHRTPVMVHVAGPRREELRAEDDDDEIEDLVLVQRCSRCGSVLNFWTDHLGTFDPHTGPRRVELNEIPWWKEGQLVAKATKPGMIDMYLVEPDRPLDKHERECADLSGLSA